MTTNPISTTAAIDEAGQDLDVLVSDGPYERETVITTSDGDDLVTIETFQRGYLGRLRRDERFTEKPGGDESHGIFTIPRRRWSPTSGAKRNVTLSPERKAELAARLAKMREEAAK